MSQSIEVLLIEDNPADVDLTREALAELKQQVNLEVVDDGEKAEAYLLKRPPYEHASRPDLILLDLNLPLRSGREVLKMMRTTPSLKPIPVVILSSSDTEMEVLKTYSLGANCYVVKPVRLSDFLELTRQVSEFWFKLVRLPPRDLPASQWLEALPCARQPATTADTPLELLLVEDNPADEELVREYLGQHSHWRLHVSRHLKGALATLESRPMDLVLLDLGLPDSQGLEGLRRIREQHQQLPIVVLTGAEGSSLGAVALREGAQDYLEKDQLNGKLLARSISYAVERSAIAREREALLERANSAREQAEEAVRLRDEFLSVASHELKTPLTTLLLQQRLLERVGSLGEPAQAEERLKRSMETIRRQCGQLSRLVDELLDVSRLGSVGLSVECTQVDLGRLVQESLESMSSQVEAAQTEVRLELEPGVVGCWDRFRIEQVVVNLLTNALKYGGRQPVEVTVRREKGQALLRVRDRGIGIREEDQQRIFGRFERAVSVRNFGGLGLGLYITRQIVNIHKGTIDLVSQPGQGACFSVWLPLEVSASC